MSSIRGGTLQRTDAFLITFIVVRNLESGTSVRRLQLLPHISTVRCQDSICSNSNSSSKRDIKHARFESRENKFSGKSIR